MKAICPYCNHNADSGLESFEHLIEHHNLPDVVWCGMCNLPVAEHLYNRFLDGGEPRHDCRAALVHHIRTWRRDNTPNMRDYPLGSWVKFNADLEAWWRRSEELLQLANILAE